MSKWTLYSNVYSLIERSLSGGSICLKAYKDFTCELPIKLFIDAFANELFISITIQNHRETYTIYDLKEFTKSQIVTKIIDFIFSTASNCLPENHGLEIFDTMQAVNALSKTIVRL